MKEFRIKDHLQSDNKILEKIYRLKPSGTDYNLYEKKVVLMDFSDFFNLFSNYFKTQTQTKNMKYCAFLRGVNVKGTAMKWQMQ